MNGNRCAAEAVRRVSNAEDPDAEATVVLRELDSAAKALAPVAVGYTRAVDQYVDAGIAEVETWLRDGPAA